MRPKPLPFMDRKVPKNDKYSHVQGVLDTGLTVNKVRTVTAREYSKRRGEIFFRLTPSQLFELYNEYDADEEENIAMEESMGDRGPRIVTHSQAETSADAYTKPYLLLDVREDFEFAEFRLMDARSFPSALVRRDYVHPEHYNFRNKEGKLIIICCDDERISQDVAKVLVDRGTDNIYLLTGGMKEFYQHFPTYFEGTVPASYIMSSPKKKAGGGSGGGSSSSSRAGSRLSTGDSTVPTSARLKLHNSTHSRTGTGTGGMGTHRSSSDSRSISAMSGATNVSVAESIISRASARKGKY